MARKNRKGRRDRFDPRDIAVAYSGNSRNMYRRPHRTWCLLAWDPDKRPDKNGDQMAPVFITLTRWDFHDGTASGKLLPPVISPYPDWLGW